MIGVIASCRALIDAGCDSELFRQSVDWAAKKAMLDQFLAEDDAPWDSAALQAYDLEYHNVDPENGLYHALFPGLKCAGIPKNEEDTRARARGLAASKFKAHLKSASWSSLSFEIDGRIEEVELSPTAVFPAQLEDIEDVGTFISTLRSIEK